MYYNIRFAFSFFFFYTWCHAYKILTKIYTLSINIIMNKIRVYKMTCVFFCRLLLKCYQATKLPSIWIRQLLREKKILKEMNDVHTNNINVICWLKLENDLWNIFIDVFFSYILADFKLHTIWSNPTGFVI